MLCTYYSPQLINVSGASFVKFNDNFWNVSVDGIIANLVGSPSCPTNLDVRSQSVYSCDSFQMNVPQIPTSIPQIAQLVVQLPIPNAGSTDNFVGSENCSVADTTSLLLLPPPTVFDLVSPVVCHNRSHTLNLTGLYLLGIGLANPSVQIGNQTIVAKQVALTNASCHALNSHVQNCSKLVVQLSPNDTLTLPSNVQNVHIQNPPPANCVGTETSSKPIQIAVVPLPTINSFSVPMTCLASRSRTISASVSNFLTIDGQTPLLSVYNLNGTSVAVNIISFSQCQNVSVNRHSIQNCGQIDFVVPQEMTTEARMLQLFYSLAPLSQCDGSTSEGLIVFPAPTLSDISPYFICSNGGDYNFTLWGINIFVVNDTLPTVTINGVPLSPSTLIPYGCTPVTSFGNQTKIQNCTNLLLMVSANLTTTFSGINNVVIQNPPPIDCNGSETSAIQFALIGQASVGSWGPTVFCYNQGPVAGFVQGGGFYSTPSNMIPNTWFGSGNHWDGPTGGEGISWCWTTIGFNRHSFSLCQRIDFTWNTYVVNAPTNLTLVMSSGDVAQCKTEISNAMTALPAPSMSSIYPPVIYADQPTSVVINGTWFLVIDGTPPTVTFGSSLSIQSLTKMSFDGCTNYTGLPGIGLLQACNSVTIQLDSTDFALMTLGTTPLNVVLINPAGCQTSAIPLVVLPPVQVYSAYPSVICSNSTQIVTFTASDILIFDSIVPNFSFQSPNGMIINSTTYGNCSNITTAQPGYNITVCTSFAISIPG